MGTRREVVAKAATGVPEPVSKPVSGPFIDLNADVGEVEDPELLEVESAADRDERQYIGVQVHMPVTPR